MKCCEQHVANIGQEMNLVLSTMEGGFGVIERLRGLADGLQI